MNNFFINLKERVLGNDAIFQEIKKLFLRDINDGEDKLVKATDLKAEEKKKKEDIL